MSGDADLRRALQRIQAPDELDAQRRAWSLARAAFEAREPLELGSGATEAAPRRGRGGRAPRGRDLAARAGARRLGAGRRDGREGGDAAGADLAARSGPAPRQLQDAGRGSCSFDGSKRLLGAWSEGSWSPNAEFVAVHAAARGGRARPDGSRPVVARALGHRRGARWSSEVNPRDTRDRLPERAGARVVGGNGTGDKELRRLVGDRRSGVAARERSSSRSRRSTAGSSSSTPRSAKTVWRTVPGRGARQLVWSEDGERLLALGERSLRVLDANGRKLWSIGLPVGPSGVAFVRESHRFVLVRYSPATGRSDLVLLQAEADPGEARFLYSAPGDFGSLAVSPNGKWLLVGWVNADQWLFLRLTAAKVQAVVEHLPAVRRRDRGQADRERFPESVSWCCPASP